MTQGIKLKIDSWGLSELTSALSAFDDDEREPIEDWISQKDDAWVMRFYALLGEACDEQDESVDAEGLRIVRVETSQGHEHVLPQEAFLLPEQETALPQDIRFVKPAVYQKGRSDAQKKLALLFLERIGVRQYDAKAIVELKLGYYENPPDQVGNGYYKDMKQFIAYWKKNPTDTDVFRGHHFLLGVSAEESLLWCEPAELCLDDPYEETGLAGLSNIHGKYAVVWDGYKKKLPESHLKDFIAFVKSIGVMHDLRVECVSSSNNPYAKELRKDYRRGAKWTSTAIDEDHSIPGIDKYLAQQSVLASRLIWNALIRADRRSATARFRPNQQCQIRESKSQLICHLRCQAWIPNNVGVFQKPEDMTKDALRVDFPYDDRKALLTAIGFGECAKKRSEDYRVKNETAKEMGFGSADEAEELAKFFSETGVTLGELRSLVSRRQRASQPEEAVLNLERRRKGVLERRDNSPTKERVTRERTIQPGAKPEVLEAKAYLRAKYRNPEGQLICQCCHAEMPFKIRDDHYFEAVQCVRGLDHHYFENRLALCPTCAAMYQHARETDDAEIRRSITEHDAPDTAPSAEVTIRLAERQFKLRFVGTHWFDLKSVLSG